ncbi:hypothetical protein BO94DRAFT_358216, partial [Aspergillus sclerotioniger CBS 115572]
PFFHIPIHRQLQNPRRITTHKPLHHTSPQPAVLPHQILIDFIHTIPRPQLGKVRPKHYLLSSRDIRKRNNLLRIIPRRPSTCINIHISILPRNRSMSHLSVKWNIHLNTLDIQWPVMRIRGREIPQPRYNPQPNEVLFSDVVFSSLTAAKGLCRSTVAKPKI